MWAWRPLFRVRVVFFATFPERSRSRPRQTIGPFRKELKNVTNVNDAVVVVNRDCSDSTLIGRTTYVRVNTLSVISISRSDPESMQQVCAGHRFHCWASENIQQQKRITYTEHLSSTNATWRHFDRNSRPSRSWILIPRTAWFVRTVYKSVDSQVD